MITQGINIESHLEPFIDEHLVDHLEEHSIHKTSHSGMSPADTNVDFHRQYNQEAEVCDIMTSTSVDFRHWTDPVFLKYPDIGPDHLYINQVTPYYRAPHVFIGLPKRFVPTRSAWDHQYDGISDAVFMTSCDGVHFKKPT